MRKEHEVKCLDAIPFRSNANAVPKEAVLRSEVADYPYAGDGLGILMLGFPDFR